jgi:uncharacterized protein YjdB
LTATTDPPAAAERVVCVSENPSIATGDPVGQVIAQALGTVNIVATAGGKTAICEVTVNQEASGITVNPHTLTLEPVQTGQLTATVTPPNALDKTVAWMSTNEAIATVDENGLVTAIARGKVIIRATNVSGQSDSCTVIVPLAAESITIDPPELLLTTAGELAPHSADLIIAIGTPPEASTAANTSATLAVTLIPAEATDDAVTWESLDPSIATVDRNTGVVTAVALGEVKIKATTSTGVEGYCDVTVARCVPVFESNATGLLAPNNGNAMDYNFSMKWVPAADVDAAVRNDSIALAAFVALIEPRPFNRRTSGGDPFAVFSTKGQLDNPDGVYIVINRYWPRNLHGTIQGMGVQTKLTVATWKAKKQTRIDDFQAAAATIQKMVDAMMTSPLYNVHVKYTELYERLRAFIKVPATVTPSTVAPADNEPFNLETYGMSQRAKHIVGDYTKNEGILYEFYFGHIPLEGEYTHGHVYDE